MLRTVARKSLMLRRVLTLTAAAIGGYLLIALGQVLFLEVLLGGRVAHDAAPWINLVGLGGTIVSGLVGGNVAARVGGERPMLHTFAVLVPLLLDTIFVLRNASDGAPLWFDLGGSGTLMAATVVGGWLHARGRLGGDPRGDDRSTPAPRSPGGEGEHLLRDG